MNPAVPTEAPSLHSLVSQEIAALTVEEIALEVEEKRLFCLIERKGELQSRLRFLRSLEEQYDKLRMIT